MFKSEAELWAALQADVDGLNGPGITPETRLETLPHWDSLAILLVITHFEQAHGIVLSSKQIRACKTGRELLQLIPANS
jgi:acyl carrier protein